MAVLISDVEYWMIILISLSLLQSCSSIILWRVHSHLFSPHSNERRPKILHGSTYRGNQPYFMSFRLSSAIAGQSGYPIYPPQIILLRLGNSAIVSVL